MVHRIRYSSVMFAATLTAHRHRAGLTVSELAARAGTSRAAISAYESGQRSPTVDTAERLLGILGATLTAVLRPQPGRARVDAASFADYAGIPADRDRALAYARAVLPIAIEAMLEAEDEHLSWGQVTTVIEGISVAGPTRAVDRLDVLTSLAHRHLRALQQNSAPQLSSVPNGVLITGHPEMPAVDRAFEFLTSAIHAGADASETIIAASAFLTHHGYPWIWGRFQRTEAVQRAIVAARRTRDGTQLITELTASFNAEEWARQ